MTVDFLIPATMPSDKGGKLRNLEDGFAAIITPGLELAFADRRLVPLDGETLHHERATREVWVCEAGAFTVLKALAFRSRGENKDAYDLVYVLQNYGGRIDDVFHRLEPLLSSPSAQEALTILASDFSAIDHVGAMRVAEFLGDPQDEAIRADAAGAVRSLLTPLPENPIIHDKRATALAEEPGTFVAHPRYDDFWKKLNSETQVATTSGGFLGGAGGIPQARFAKCNALFISSTAVAPAPRRAPGNPPVAAAGPGRRRRGASGCSRRRLPP